MNSKMPEMEVVSAYKKKRIKPKFKLNTIAYRLFAPVVCLIKIYICVLIT